MGVHPNELTICDLYPQQSVPSPDCAHTHDPSQPCGCARLTDAELHAADADNALRATAVHILFSSRRLHLDALKEGFQGGALAFGLELSSVHVHVQHVHVHAVLSCPTRTRLPRAAVDNLPPDEATSYETQSRSCYDFTESLASLPPSQMAIVLRGRPLGGAHELARLLRFRTPEELQLDERSPPVRPDVAKEVEEWFVEWVMSLEEVRPARPTALACFLCCLLPAA